MEKLFSFYGRVILLLVTVLILTIVPIQLSAQETPTIDVQPPSGPPGTTVTIRDLGGTEGILCYARIGSDQARSIGAMAQQLTYVVDRTLPPGTVITLWCAVRGGVSSNRVQFTVTAPDTTPVDTDNDGLPDSVDACPELPGPRENSGCPPQPQPTDSDGDGIADDRDACPLEAGTADANGCAPTLTPPPQIELPALPTSGACMVATLGTAAVNVRAEPSTEAAVTGALQPTEIYNVFGRTSDFEWWQVNGGWVAAWVTRTGGDCSIVPAADSAPAPASPQDLTQQEDGYTETGQPQPAIVSHDNGDSMSACPELLPALQEMPIFLALHIVGEPDPCAAAQAQIDDLFLNPAALNPVTVPECAGDPAYGYYLYTLLLSSVEEPTRSYLVEKAQYAEFCTLLHDLENGVISEQSATPDMHIAPMTLQLCYLFAVPDGLPARVAFVDPPAGLLRNFLGQACDFYAYLHVPGSLRQENVDLFKQLVDTCGVDIGAAAKLAYSDAIRGALDAGAYVNEGCAIFQTLGNFPLPPDLAPRLPQIAAGDANCTGNFRMLATHNASLGAEDLYRILKSSDPCAAADAYAHKRQLPSFVTDPPACIQGDAMTIGSTLADQQVIDTGSPWHLKIAALDRPLNEICSGLTGQGGDLAVPPTPTMGALAANPTPTPPVLVANPTATLPVIVANPTTTPELDLGAVATATPTPITPNEMTPTPALQNSDQQAQDTGDVPSAGGTEVAACFGCLPDQVLFPTGRLRAVAIATDENGNLGLLAVDAGVPQDPLTGLQHFVPLSLDSLPSGMTLNEQAGGFVSVFDGGTDQTIVLLARGGVENLPASVQQIRIVAPAGSDAGSADQPADSSAVVIFAALDNSEGSAGLDVRTSLIFPPSLTPAPYAPAWSPDGESMYITLTDGTGQTAIYQLLLKNVSDIVQPVLLVQNAFAPTVASDGRYLAFVREDPTGSDVYVLAFNSLRESAITQQPAGASCYGPQFATDSIEMYFTCEANGETQMYAYGLKGVRPIETGIPNAQNPRPGERNGFIYFDDGQTLYLAADDGSGVSPVAGKSHEKWISIDSVSVPIHRPGGSN